MPVEENIQGGLRLNETPGKGIAQQTFLRGSSRVNGIEQEAVLSLLLGKFAENPACQAERKRGF
jgi:hypothetical protein